MRSGEGLLVDDGSAFAIHHFIALILGSNQGLRELDLITVVPSGSFLI
jgi:hypothetical protein